VAQDQIARCGLFQRANPGGRRFRSSSEAIRTPIALEAQQAFASRSAFVSACGEESVEVRPSASRAGCDRVLPAFTRICRSNHRIRLQNKSLVTGNRAEIEIAVAGSLCRGARRQHFYLVKISFIPAIRSTVARQTEITRTAKRLLPKCEPMAPPIIAAAERIRPSEGME